MLEPPVHCFGLRGSACLLPRPRSRLGDHSPDPAGRKRYLGLAFVTQLPSHLPDEVFGLINNWILHKITDTSVIQRLRKVVPAVNQATWSALPNLAPGQALSSFTHLTRPIMTAVDPSPSQLRMVD